MWLFAEIRRPLAFLGHLCVIELVEVGHIVLSLDGGLVGSLHLVRLKPGPIERTEPLVLDDGGGVPVRESSGVADVPGGQVGTGRAGRGDVVEDGVDGLGGLLRGEAGDGAAGCERLLSPGCGSLTATALCRSW